MVKEKPKIKNQKSKIINKGTKWQRFKGIKKDFNLVPLCLCPLFTILNLEL